MSRITFLLFLTFLITQAIPLHRQNDVTSALAPPPSPSVTPSPTPTSSTVDDNLSSDVQPTPTPISDTETIPQPVSSTPSPTDTLINLGSDNPDQDDGQTDDDDDYDGTDDSTETEDINQQSDDPDPKSVETGIASPASISALALVGIALAILAPAVLIYWAIRRRSQTTVVGFENMPEAEENTYRGPPRDTFTVA